ncbi:MAG: Signal transduction histidine kinase [Rhodoferax ferrireducens]|uniref:Signal transduction histidine kinase n=1 Tax=Rhodoferax ferrireducens TaxID=192843 RepID=A0A1W9KZV3_9BURK|nr:MAG: Signal transduction histidine kinase [Rhodoferax ferrireducens]
MKLRTLSLLLILLLIAAFTLLNWPVIMAPTPLSLGVVDIQAPLGLLMLGLMVAMLSVFLVYVLYLQTTVMFDARAHAKELQSNRKLADQAEASRFTELRTFLDTEFKRQSAADGEVKAALLARIDRLERELRLAVEQSGNSLAASIGEMDDRQRAGNPALR